MTTIMDSCEAEKCLTGANDMTTPEQPLRLSAYYFSFEPTGVPEIDMILSAVACAGECYHHTEQWNDDAAFGYEPHTGNTPVEWIQNAANAAAKQRATSDDVTDAVSKALRQAWQLGQLYWQQADSPSYRQNARSDETQAKFRKLVDEVRVLLQPTPATQDSPLRPDGMPSSADERMLHRMLCSAYCGPTAYTDDGEASDSSMHPAIDFMRMPPEQIRQLIIERNTAKWKATQDSQQAEKVATPRDEWPQDADGALGHLAGCAFGTAPSDEIGHCVGVIRDALAPVVAPPELPHDLEDALWDSMLEWADERNTSQEGKATKSAEEALAAYVQAYARQAVAEALARRDAQANTPGTNTGHGHVWARPDGVKARCGGPALCKQCSADAARRDGE